MNATFLEILDIRVTFEKALINGDELTQEENMIEAHIAGANAQFAGEVQIPALFRNVPQLNEAWHDGWEASTRGAHWRLHVEENGCELKADAEESRDNDLAEMRAAEIALLDGVIEDIPQEVWDSYPFGFDESESNCFDDDVTH